MANKPSASEDAGILEELVEATGVKYKTGESAQDYAKRLALAVDKLADADWKAMSEPSQLWANAAVIAADDKKDIDLLPGMVGDDADAGDAPDAEADDAPGEEEPDAEEPDAADGESEEAEEPEPKSADKKALGKKGKKESVAKKPAAAKQAAAKPVDKKARESDKKVAAKSVPKFAGKKAPTDKKPKKAAASDAKGRAKPRKPSTEPRAGTKRAKLIEMLSRAKGATVAEIAKDFGWEPHTTRASISMARKAGAKVASEEDGKRGRVYRIEA